MTERGECLLLFVLRAHPNSNVYLSPILSSFSMFCFSFQNMFTLQPFTKYASYATNKNIIKDSKIVFYATRKIIPYLL
jgi:deoxyadenosine/deoxycytidine kinase